MGSDQTEGSMEVIADDVPAAPAWSLEDDDEDDVADLIFNGGEEGILLL